MSTLQKPAPRQSLTRPNASLSDTDRLNALFTLMGGSYAFSAFFDLNSIMRDGRRGIDELIAGNPSLLGKQSK